MLDSLGIGGAPDAARYGDEGADTLGHIAGWFLENEGRELFLPNLGKLGIWEAWKLAGGGLLGTGLGTGLGIGGNGRDAHATGLGRDIQATIAFVVGTELSTGKDTPSGHWELMGVVADWSGGIFEMRRSVFRRTYWW